MSSNIFNNRILVVEDEHFMRMLVTQSLNSLGFDAVLEAEHGDEALRVIDRKPVDIILSDIEMKPMNGLEFVRRVRAGKSSATRDTRVMFLTGLSDIATLSSASELDVHGFLVKPISAKQLMEKIREAVETEITLKAPELYEGLSFAPARIERRDKHGQPGYTVTTVPPNQSAHEYSSVERKEQNPSEPQQTTSSLQSLEIGRLRPGMVLCQDVLARGVLMLKKGTVLGQGHVLVLRDMRSVLEHELIAVEVPLA